MTRTLLVLSSRSLTAASVPPNSAVTVSECSARFFAAQKNESLNGLDWNSFRENACGTTTGKALPSLRHASGLAPPASRSALTRGRGGALNRPSQAVAASCTLPNERCSGSAS